MRSSPSDGRSSCGSNGGDSSGKSSLRSSTDSINDSTVRSSSQDDKKLTIILRQSWFDTRCASGDYVHLTGSFEELDDGSSPGMLVAVVDDLNNMIILHPDHLLSATVVADSFGCVRRAVLQDRVKATNEPSEAQVYGHILHEIFQAGLRTNRWDRQYLGQVAEDIVRRHHLEDLYLINVDLRRAIAHLTDRVAEFEAWAKMFVCVEPQVRHHEPELALSHCILLLEFQTTEGIELTHEPDHVARGYCGREKWKTSYSRHKQVARRRRARVVADVRPQRKH